MSRHASGNGKRKDRLEAIRKIVGSRQIKTQQQLSDVLVSVGFSCTQATVSRDISDLRLLKDDTGCYVLPETQRLRRVSSGMVISAVAAGHLVVVKTHGGSASTLAAAIDEAAQPGCLGTVAGDDTVFVAVESAEHGLHFASLLNSYIQ